MTFNNFLPPKIYAFLVKIAQERNLSVKEIQRIFLNKVAKDLGFVCDHERVGFAKEDPNHKPYCKDCWTRLVTIKPPVVNGRKIVKQGQFWPLKTFLDSFYDEGTNKDSNLRKIDQKNQNEKSDII
jgi:hypothetical protein